ncbi:MAG: hypothetical protein Q8807_00750 ['Waltheria sp.' little leaf phytoplasma]|nr:hypothetical protein ['Waltheria sp.' little leaf phytoplasma]
MFDFLTESEIIKLSKEEILVIKETNSENVEQWFNNNKNIL